MIPNFEKKNENEYQIQYIYIYRYIRIFEVKKMLQFISAFKISCTYVEKAKFPIAERT